MELEQRVKTLEYEIKILKNEIQRTLLEIQEQVLIHYHPSLRTEDQPVPPPVIPVIETPPPRPSGNNGHAQALGVDAAGKPLIPPLNDEPEIPIVRKVSLDQVRAAHNEGPASPEETERMSKLLEWALNGAAQIGSARIKALIQVCAQRNIIAPEVQEVLLRIAPLNRRAAPEGAGLREMIQVILQLDAILERPADVEEALVLIGEANLG